MKKHAEKYNDLRWFEEDPSRFPRTFVGRLGNGGACLKDVEISGILSAHLAWGRRAMIVRDCGRMFDEMGWKPYDYVMKGEFRNGGESLHRTVKWSEFADICSRLRGLYLLHDSLENLSPDEFRTLVFGQKSDPKSANKKIHMFRRWMVRRDGKVDFGLWKDTDPAGLIIPLDVHVHATAKEMGITARNSADFRTASEITDWFKDIFPDDPCKGDFALFGYGIDKSR